VSTDIYSRIGFVEKYLTRIFLRGYEVTIKQNLVYEILKFEIETGLKFVDIYESQISRKMQWIYFRDFK